MAGERCEHKGCRYNNREGASNCAGCGRELPKRISDVTSKGDLVVAAIPPIGLVFVFLAILNGQPRRARNIYIITFVACLVIVATLKLAQDRTDFGSMIIRSLMQGAVMIFGFSYLAARNVRRPSRLFLGVIIWALIAAILGTIGKG